MTEVILHVYDVTNSASAKTNNTILQINKIFKDGIGFGGIFHSAVQVFGDEEWSFGFCERGTGVFSCPVGKNPMYTYREFIVLGKTNFSIFKVNQILRELSREWPGDSYDLLARNCNHFCDELCERLGVPKLPAWVNRFANAGYAASEVAGNTALKVFGDEEWSFGFCERGTGVFSCPVGKNPMYTYREFIVLGKTNFSIFKVNQILRELSREWPGDSYDLLARNCNHFCDELCERLGVPKLPAWVNRFANAGYAASEVAGNTALKFRQAKAEIVSASRVAYRFLSNVTSNSAVTPESPSNSNRGSPRFQASWIKNIISNGSKPTTSSELETQSEDKHMLHASAEEPFHSSGRRSGA